MNKFIALMLPSSLGTIIYLRNTTKENEKFGIYVYLLNTLLTNIISYVFMYSVKGIKSFNFTNVFTVKYSLCSLIISVFLSILFVIVSKNIKLNVEVKEVINNEGKVEVREEKNSSKETKKRKNIKNNK